MPLVSRKGILAIAAVIDVALNARAARFRQRRWRPGISLPPRHLEPVLQALVRDGILKGIRGPHGGYELGRERSSITADDILRAAGRAEDADALPLTGSALVNEMVRPALGRSRTHVLRRRSAESMSTTWSRASRC